MEVFRSDTPDIDAGVALSKILEQNMGIPVLLLLSGGSAFKLLSSVKLGALGINITMAVLDERCSIDPNVNNFMQLTETDFFNVAAGVGAQWIDTSISAEDSCENAAIAFENKLLKWIDSHKKGKVVATMGIGGDGHTAGIMPNVEEDFETSHVVSYEVSKEINEHTKRITTTHKFLREYVDEAIVYAVGEEKQPLIEILENKAKNKDEMPAQILNEMKKVQLFTGA